MTKKYLLLFIFMLSITSNAKSNIQSEWFEYDVSVDVEETQKRNPTIDTQEYSIEDGDPNELWGEENEKKKRKRRKPAPKNSGPLVQRIPFPVSEYNRLKKEGTGVIYGQIKVLKESGKKIPTPSSNIYLNPVTSYSEQWYEKGYMGGHKMTPPDNRLFQYMRFTSSDKKGNFRFDNVPEGEYFISCKVDCNGGCGKDKSEILYLVDHIYIKDGLEIKKDLIAEE